MSQNRNAMGYGVGTVYRPLRGSRTSPQQKAKSAQHRAMVRAYAIKGGFEPRVRGPKRTAAEKKQYAQAYRARYMYLAKKGGYEPKARNIFKSTMPGLERINPFSIANVTSTGSYKKRNVNNNNNVNPFGGGLY
jgi:hypothetical protein